ncbi:MAG TPA: TetR/AcrR family transcriptional regulator [Spirochaetia bacterium]|nr:TetR/AcrR family transcriptional regulator [Spirochaetia bacterium]
MTTKVRSSKPYHHGALRQALIGEAMEALEKEGLDGLSLRGLAASAGVSKTAPYRHFADKHELLVTLAAEGFRELADVLEAAALGAPAADHATPDAKPAGIPDGPTRGIRMLFRAYLQFARTRPALYQLMVSRLGFSLHSESCRINSGRAFQCLVRAVENAQKAGWRSERNTMAVVLSLWAEVHGWALLLIEDLLPPEAVGPNADTAGMAEALLD